VLYLEAQGGYHRRGTDCSTEHQAIHEMARLQLHHLSDCRVQLVVVKSVVSLQDHEDGDGDGVS